MNTIYFNGNKVIGNNNTISINGQNCVNGETKKVDVKKTTNANNISRITVNCDLANVQINAVDTNNITTNFFGQFTTDGSIHFDVSVNNDFHASTGYTARGKINAFNGDIKIR